MADDTLHTKVISKNNSGFPDYLDFDKLRREGIDYLGKLAGKIWTDHNVHDPGITILESLCYALLDLGYRTNLPVEDILSGTPNGKDDNFFTPAQILACNPLTITDYRKLLIDIAGVKNAWLEVATDQKDPCRENRSSDYLNGLYHVYIETEQTAEVKESDIICKVKKALMAHRNLCEDFVDVSILCKLPVGVCAEIELDADAEVEKVYLDIAQQLQAFFSPGPRFYTLPQLLDKKVPIEEIFAGRPYNLTESHGFVDTNELEQIPLRKVIHVSDVYNVIFQVVGVRKIKNLKLRLCEGELPAGKNEWEIVLPKNHLPEFTIGCSGFQFLKNGNPITIDTARYEGLLSINFANTGKILYTTPLPNLDSEIPRGIYRPDMGDYYSIQNDFPRVYGIGDGGLPDSAPDARKAQALQLKAYLLFFDQLLANYLSQLKNIRSLFVMAAPEADSRHTYFLNGLNSVPDLDKLLRMPATEQDALESGGKGSTLMYPVSKTQLLQWKEANPNTPFDPDALPPYTFGSLAEQEILLQQLKENLSQQQYEKGQLGFVSKTKDPSVINYYLIPFSTDFALISKKVFTTATAADTDAGTAVFVAGFNDNYRTFITSNNRVSFDIELNLATYSRYLQNIVEDDAGYASRRNTFLDHLLSRFAEQFTDFALLSYKQYSTEEAATLANIKAKEDFLTHYDDISSNRGKAYDYVENNWNTDNISGYEKTVKYTSGIENKKEHSLCNFIVAEYDDLFQVNIRIAGNAFYALPEKFNSRLEAQETARDVFAALSDQSKLTTRYLAHERLYTLQLEYGSNKYTNYADSWATEQQADEVRQAMVRLFDLQPTQSDVYISEYMYRLHLLNNAGDITRTAREFTTIEEEAKHSLQQSPENINNPDGWLPVDTIPQPGNNLYQVSASEEQVQFIDVTVFKIDIDNTIVGHPDKFTYEVLDQANTFKFSPVEMFATTGEAMAHCYSVLALAAIDTNYQVGKNNVHGNFTLYITGNGVIQAICATEFNTEEEALEEQKKVYAIIRNWVYRVIIDKSPYRWRYNFFPGYKENERFTFTSIPDYTGSEAAFTAAVLLHQSIPQLEARQEKNQIILSAGKKNIDIPSVAMPVETEPSPLPAVQLALDTHKRVYPLIGNTDTQAYNEFVELDEISQQGRYVYRLVDKDNIYATWSQAYYTKEDADEARRRMQTWLRQPHMYLDICLGGGNLINERTDANSTVITYHYVVKCHNLQYQSGPQQGQPLVLFESVTGYSSAKEAELAFNQQYLEVFDKATDVNNYGSIISLDEAILQNTFRDAETLVFVPAVTVDYFRSISTQPIAEQIAAIVKTYPIKRVKYGSDQFRRLFPCENVPQTNDDCSTRPYVYYFSLQADATAGTNWQSLKYYTTPEAARKDFLFFIMLLKYAGNLFVDCDNCIRDSKYPWRIYIREVLAESARRFLEEPFAWGEEGIEKFICAIQSGAGFHNHLRSIGCCYSFYLNSGIDFITHPCKYDSADKRTAVMQELYYQLQHMQGAGAWSTQWEGNTLLVKDENGRPFAQHIFDNANDQNNCNWLVQLPSKITDSNNRYLERDGNFYLLDTREQTILQSYKSNYTLESWKAELFKYACYYPIVEYTDEAANTTKYCIEIRIPGFHPCGDDQPGLQPCGCNDEAPATEPDCYLAWRSTCCYSTCDDAQTVLAIAYRLLINFSNYQPEFDCESNSYGIALTWHTAGQQPPPKNIKLSGHLIAYNPQCYTTPDNVCDAVERTKTLTNGEGLHVVEHILLRPYNSDDCVNRIPIVCQQRMHQCGFPWEVEQKDPCSNEEDEIIFEPGVDPYSFIATIVLPAWSARFRTPEGRLLIENILYRSAPAHVMLRILWLAPHDLCCFEEKYKSWRRYLAQKRVCNQNFSVDQFLEFLFHRKFEELKECDNSSPCATNGQVQESPCITESKQRFKDKQISFTDEVNQEYCWKVNGEYVWGPCDQQRNADPIDVKDNQPVLTEETPPATAPAVVEAKAPEETVTVEPVAAPQPREAAASMTFIRKKGLFVNSRLDGYRRIAKEVIDKSNNNPLAIEIEDYLAKPSPTPKKTETLIDRLLDNAKPIDKGVKRLSRDMKKDLITAIVRFYLDKISFGSLDAKQVKQSGGIFEKIRNAKINVQTIYDDWNGAEVKTYEPGVNLDALYELVTGIKK
jgi:hypothetical protein